MLLRPPFFYPWLYPSCVWNVQHLPNTVWLTFDDGPYPPLTSFILEQLDRFNAKACFFCVGSQVEKFPEEYDLIIKQNHLTGNHTHTHIDSWKHPSDKVIQDIQHAENFISSSLYRPPYGLLTRNIQKYTEQKFTSVMWSLLAYDWQSNLSHYRVLKNITEHVKSGDIIVLHDSKKSEKHIKAILPNLLQTLMMRGFEIRNPELEILRTK